MGYRRRKKEKLKKIRVSMKILSNYQEMFLKVMIKEQKIKLKINEILGSNIKEVKSHY